MKKRKAFSLLELLAVVTILGIIAAIVVPRVQVSTDAAKNEVNSHNMATMNAAIERYYVDNDDWPAALTSAASSAISIQATAPSLSRT